MQKSYRLAFALVTLSCLMPCYRARACALVTSVGDKLVAISTEEVIIAWDAKAHLEHFIRKVGFETAASDFGFIVPTPTKPEIAEADNGVLDRLHAYMDKEKKNQGFVAKGAIVAAAANSVRVLETKEVAGMDVAVLEAHDPSALVAWLKAHDYKARPQLKEWAEPYLAARWKMTAFKFAGSPKTPSGAKELKINARAIRLTFSTPEPVYPYREPSDTLSGVQRLLHLFFVSDGVAAGSLRGEEKSSEWLAAVDFSERMPMKLVPELLKGSVPDPKVFDGAWLTVFVDHAVIRPPKELYFTVTPPVLPAVNE